MAENQAGFAGILDDAAQVRSDMLKNGMRKK
jgi:hypothetical protein